MTQPTAEHLEVTQADRDLWKYLLDAPKSQCTMMDTCNPATAELQAIARHRQATEARMAAAVEADVEKIARIIDPSSWAVMDGYLSDMLRKYKGQNIGYDPDAFKHKPSMKIAEKVLAAIRSQSNG